MFAPAAVGQGAELPGGVAVGLPVVDPTQAAHLELARLFDQLERPDEANRHYRASVGPAGDR